MKKALKCFTSYILIQTLVCTNFFFPFEIVATYTADLDSIVLPMNYVNDEGNLINQDGSPIKTTLFATFWGNCGSATLTASGSLVNIVIRPTGWVAWSFYGNVMDSHEGSHYFSVGNTGNSYSYELNDRYGQRILTLTGTATDITGSMCAIVPNAFINHYW